MRQSKAPKITLFVCLFFYSVALIGQDTEPGEWPNHKFDFMLKASMNYLDFDDLGFLEIPSDAKFGAGLGLAYEWKMMEKNHLRADVQYEFQSMENSFEEGGNTSNTKITNHILGFNVFPISYRFGNKIKPVISLGAYANVIISSDIKTDVNQQSFAAQFDTNSLQFGWTIGAGVYLGQKLVEVRYKQALNDFISNIETTNRIDQISFIVVL